MNKKYERYINYIVDDIEAPYYENMRDRYGLKDSEYELVLSKIFNQPVTIKSNDVYNTNGNVIYYEDITGYWSKREYDTKDNLIYIEDSNGRKRGYDANDNEIYIEDSTGYWKKYEYDANGNLIYSEDSNGRIYDNR
jgi:YD repeat-containing protein